MLVSAMEVIKEKQIYWRQWFTQKRLLIRAVGVKLFRYLSLRSRSLVLSLASRVDEVRENDVQYTWSSYSKVSCHGKDIF